MSQNVPTHGASGDSDSIGTWNVCTSRGYEISDHLVSDRPLLVIRGGGFLSQGHTFHTPEGGLETPVAISLKEIRSWYDSPGHVPLESHDPFWDSRRPAPSWRHLLISLTAPPPDPRPEGRPLPHPVGL